MRKKLYLVDISSMFFRAFYAIRQLSNQSGMPTNAVYGVLSMTVKLLREVKPDYMAFCFDRPEPSFRRDIDPNYKANRTEMPEDLVPQVPYLRKLGHALGVPCFDRKGYEADDIIGCLTHYGLQHDLDVIIVSGDKDFAQLIGPHVTMYDTMKDARIDAAAALEKWGVEPRQMRDYLAIVGDSSDNVPGVKGIGPKGAQKLLNQFGDLDGIYTNLQSVDSKSVREKLDLAKAQAYLSQKLVTIVCDLDLGLSLDDLRLKPIVREDLRALLDELDFKSFAKTLLGNEVGNQVVPPPAESPSPASAPVPTAAVSAPVSRLGSDSGVVSFKWQRSDIGQLASSLQAKGLVWGTVSERGVYIAQDGVVHEVSGDWEPLGKMLSEKDLAWQGFDVKELWKHLRVKQGRAQWDHMLAAYVLKPGKEFDFPALLKLYVGEALPELPSPEQWMQAHQRLAFQLNERVQAQSGQKILHELELPLVRVLLDMENAGVKIDRQLFSEQSVELARDIQILEKEIHQMAGEVFNIASPKQLGQILFVKLKVPTAKKTKTGFSTDNEVLEKLIGEFPICGKVLQYRELAKLKSTYVDAIPALVREDGRVHTTFNQAVAATGRLSSTNPNMQNIPIRTERGNRIRRGFIAEEGKVFVSADYSQIELRVLAHISGDEGLKRAFANDLDVHAATAAEVFEVPLEQVTSEMRRQAKAVNFGLAYGQGAFGLAENLQIERKQASEIIQRYFTRFPGVKTYMQDIVETAKKQGYVESMFGRRRYLDELQSKSPMIRKFGERAAINAPMQGTSSDIVKLAMIRLAESTQYPLLLQVHDELIFEVEVSQAESAKQVIQSQMEAVGQLSVPLKVNVGSGANWDEAHT